jgi:hypothetical protein
MGEGPRWYTASTDQRDQRRERAMTYTIKVPKRFYDDHRYRECGRSGKIVKEYASHYLVELDQEAWDDLYSDADYYGMDNPDEDLWQNYRGVILSARATLKVMTEYKLEGEGK